MKKFFIDICLEVDGKDENEAWEKVAKVVDNDQFKKLLKSFHIYDDDVTVSEPSEMWDTETWQ